MDKFNITLYVYRVTQGSDNSPYVGINFRRAALNVLKWIKTPNKSYREDESRNMDGTSESSLVAMLTLSYLKQGSNIMSSCPKLESLIRRRKAVTVKSCTLMRLTRMRVTNKDL